MMIYEPKAKKCLYLGIPTYLINFCLKAERTEIPLLSCSLFIFKMVVVDLGSH
jgi:hypothetical protein